MSAINQANGFANNIDKLNEVLINFTLFLCYAIGSNTCKIMTISTQWAPTQNNDIITTT